jgi:hypothetical protein
LGGDALLTGNLLLDGPNSGHGFHVKRHSCASQSSAWKNTNPFHVSIQERDVHNH